MEVVRSFLKNDLTSDDVQPNALYYLMCNGNVDDRTEAIDMAKAGIPVSKTLAKDIVIARKDEDLVP